MAVGRSCRLRSNASKGWSLERVRSIEGTSIAGEQTTAAGEKEFCSQWILAEFPVLSTDRTRILALQPPRHTLQMKGVSALSPNDRTIFAGIFGARRRALKGGLTNAADIVVGVPRPLSDGVQAFDAYRETGGGVRGGRRRGIARALHCHCGSSCAAVLCVPFGDAAKRTRKRWKNSYWADRHIERMCSTQADWTCPLTHVTHNTLILL